MNRYQAMLKGNHLNRKEKRSPFLHSNCNVEEEGASLAVTKENNRLHQTSTTDSALSTSKSPATLLQLWYGQPVSERRKTCPHRRQGMEGWHPQFTSRGDKGSCHGVAWPRTRQWESTWNPEGARDEVDWFRSFSNYLKWHSVVINSKSLNKNANIVILYCIVDISKCQWVEWQCV